MADIRHAVQVSAGAETIHRLVATAAGLAEWWAEDVTETEGAVDLGFFRRQTVYRLRMAGAPDAGRVEWACESGEEWKGTRLVFEMAPAGSGPLLRFTHAGWQAASDSFVSCNTTWGELMFRLKAAAEGKGRGPLFSRDGMGY